MISHSATLCWHWANQCFPYHNNVKCLSKEQQLQPNKKYVHAYQMWKNKEKNHVIHKLSLTYIMNPPNLVIYYPLNTESTDKIHKLTHIYIWIRTTILLSTWDARMHCRPFFVKAPPTAEPPMSVSRQARTHSAISSEHIKEHAHVLINPKKCASLQSGLFSLEHCTRCLTDEVGSTSKHQGRIYV